MYISRRYSHSASWNGWKRRDRARSRKTKTREGSATPVQVRASELLVGGSGHREEVNSRDIQKIGTRLMTN